MKKNNQKSHLKLKRTLVVILVIYLGSLLGYYLVRLPVKNIYIFDNYYVTDAEIIESAGLKDYPSIWKIKKRQIKKKIKQNDLVNDVIVTINWRGKVTIKIDEARPVFMNRSDDVIYLDNGRYIVNDNRFLGLPILVNFVPDGVLVPFLKKMKKIDINIINMINEIEYYPEEKDGVSLDDTRFKLRMNDTNTVYVNTINLTKLNDYAKICATAGAVKGIVYLNSNRTTITITPYENKTAAQGNTDV